MSDDTRTDNGMSYTSTSGTVHATYTSFTAAGRRLFPLCQGWKPGMTPLRPVGDAPVTCKRCLRRAGKAGK